MMDGVMNLCRVKFRDHQRLTRQALCRSIRCRPTRAWATCRAPATTRAAASSATRSTASRTAPNDWLYVVVQEAVWEALAKRIGPDAGHAGPGRRPAPRHHRASGARTSSSCGRCINKFAEKLHQARVHGDPESPRRAVRPDHVHRGPRQRRARARARHVGRARPSAARQVVQRRHADQALGLARGDPALADAGRAHRGGPEERAGLRRREGRPGSRARAHSPRRRRRWPPDEDRDHRPAGFRKSGARGLPRARR